MAYSREQKKYIAVARARRRLERRLEDIDWELDVLADEVEQIGELAQSNQVEIGVGDMGDEDVSA